MVAGLSKNQSDVALTKSVQSHPARIRLVWHRLEKYGSAELMAVLFITKDTEGYLHFMGFSNSIFVLGGIYTESPRPAPKKLLPGTIDKVYNRPG